jgi:hypothetical protein
VAIAGMMVGNLMTATVLVARRLVDELWEDNPPETRQTSSATRSTWPGSWLTHSTAIPCRVNPLTACSNTRVAAASSEDVGSLQQQHRGPRHQGARDAHPLGLSSGLGVASRSSQEPSNAAPASASSSRRGRHPGKRSAGCLARPGNGVGR